MADIYFDLVTWPLELVDWPYQNSHRTDIRINPEMNRNYQYGTESATKLPNNEVGRFRWNADPFTMDGGSGRVENEPGPFLLPYWLARFHGFIE